MKSRKHLFPTQRLYLLAVDTSWKAFSRLDREEAKGGDRSWWTNRLFYWYGKLHDALMERLAEFDTLKGRKP